jgi:hypothetical protein
LDEEAALLRQVVDALERIAVPYMIGGSVALGVWATPRMTHDLDIVVDVPLAEIPQFCAQFPAERYYLDPAAMTVAFRQRDSRSQGMYSFLDMDTGLKVDLFPLRPGDPAQVTAMGRRVRAEVLSSQPAYVYAPDDLLIQKLRWYSMGESQRQFTDCLALLIADRARPSPLIDRAYVQGCVDLLGRAVQGAWARLLATTDEATPPAR